MCQLVSIVVPIYNVECYLEKCIESLLKQIYKNYEILLIDDGSTDGSSKIADYYAKGNAKVKVFHKKNGGLGDARNFGVKQSKGEWIVFVDSDDYVSETYVYDLVNLKNEYNADMAITAIQRIKEGDKLPRHNRFDNYCVSGKEAITEVYIGSKVGWAAYGKILKKEHLLNVPFPIGYYEDCACMYKILEHCEKVAIGDYVANYKYIMRDGSILQSQLTNKHLKIFEICDEFYSFGKNNNLPEIVSVMFYRNAVVQLLRCQKMSWDDYCKIFSKYTEYFRNNLQLVIKTSKVALVYKIYYIALCTHPIFFKVLMKVVDAVK